MNDVNKELNGERKHALQEEQLLVRDIARYLSSLARLNETGKISNPELSDALRQVVDALRLYNSYPVRELAGVLREAKSQKRNRGPLGRKPAVTLPSNLDSLEMKEIEDILADEKYTKDQLAELGFRRFGISRAKLMGLRKEDAKNSVRAALENEKSLDVISEMARKAGKARAS